MTRTPRELTLLTGADRMLADRNVGSTPATSVFSRPPGNGRFSHRCPAFSSVPMTLLHLGKLMADGQAASRLLTTTPTLRPLSATSPFGLRRKRSVANKTYRRPNASESMIEQNILRNIPAVPWLASVTRECCWTTVGPDHTNLGKAFTRPTQKRKWTSASRRNVDRVEATSNGKP